MTTKGDYEAMWSRVKENASHRADRLRAGPIATKALALCDFVQMVLPGGEWTAAADELAQLLMAIERRENDQKEEIEMHKRFARTFL